MKDELFDSRGLLFRESSRNSKKRPPKNRHKASKESNPPSNIVRVLFDTSGDHFEEPPGIVQKLTLLYSRDIAHIGVSGRIFVFQVAPGREFEHIYLFCAGLFIYLNC